MLLIISYMANILLSAYFCYEAIALSIYFDFSAAVGVSELLWLLMNLIFIVILIAVSTSLTQEVTMIS